MASPVAAPQVRAERLLPSTYESVAHARTIAIGLLASAGLSADCTDDVSMVVSELVTNAIRHTGGTAFHLSASVQDRVVRVAVSDCSKELPMRMVDSDEHEGGRGIAVVEALSKEWGATLLPLGKTVWATIRAR